MHTAEAIDTLVALMRRHDEVPAIAERAAEALLDRGWGRPDVSANIKIERNVRALSTDELLADIASRLALGASRTQSRLVTAALAYLPR